MKRIVLLLSLLLSERLVFAQESFQMARPAGTPQISGTPGVSTKAAVDKYGNQQVVLVPSAGGSGAANTVNVVATPGASSLAKSAVTGTYASGDVGIASLIAVRSDGGSLATQATAGSYTALASTNTGNLYVIPSYDSNTNGAKQLAKLEDSAAASGDALVGVAGVINYTLGTPAASGDYAAPALGTFGQSLSSLIIDGNLAGSTPIRQEDSVAATTDAGVVTLLSTNSALAADAAANNDYSLIQGDELGRTITTLAPAGETWQACSANTTTNITAAIKAAVASNRIYVTELSCVNAAAVASLITIKDGATQLYIDYMPVAAAGGRAAKTFPVPLRGTVNTALNVTYSTTGIDSYCCASGYISVN